MSNNPGNDVTNLALRLAVDEATLARSQQGLNLLSQRLQNLRSDTRAAGADIKTSLGGVADGIAKATPLMDRLAQASKQAAEEAKKAAGNWNDLRDSLNSSGGLSSGGGSGFGIEGLRRTGGALNQVGLQGPGQAVQRVGDVAQIAKEFQLLAQEGEALSKAMTGLPGLLGEVAAEGVASGTAFGGVLAVMGPLVAALAAVGLAFKVFVVDVVQKGTQDINDAVDTQVKYMENARKLTTEQAQAALDELSADQSGKQKLKKVILDQIQAAQDVIGGKDFKIYSPEQIAAAGASIVALRGALDKLNKTFDTNKIAIDALSNGLLDDAFAANDAKVAHEKELQAKVEAAKTESDIAKQQYADSQMNSTAAQKKAEQLKVNIDADQLELARLKALGDESPIVQDRIKQLETSLKANGAEWENLTQILIPAAKNAERLAKAEEARKKKTEELAKAEEENNKKIADTYQKYKDDVASIEQKAADERAAINKKLADTLIAEAQKALEQSQDALKKLEDKRADLLTNYNQGELDARQKAQQDDLTLQINAQREEVKAYQDHVRRLDDIRKSEWANEQQALLDRNFVALAKSRLTVATNMNQENTSFGRSQQDRAATLAASKQDTERQRAVEHQQRLEAYNQANADANKQYQRELRDQQIARERAIAAAQKAHDEDLKMLAQKTRAELDARAKAEKAELEIMIKGAKARVELEAKTQEALLNEAKAFAGARISTNAANPHSGTQFNLNLGQYARRAGGGPLSAGQPAIVNDGNGREAFNGQLLPGGAGIFYPLKSGVVSGATGGTQFHQENHISGVSDPKAVADMIKQQTVTLLEQVLNG